MGTATNRAVGEAGNLLEVAGHHRIQPVARPGLVGLVRPSVEENGAAGVGDGRQRTQVMAGDGATSDERDPHGFGHRLSVADPGASDGNRVTVLFAGAGRARVTGPAHRLDRR